MNIERNLKIIIILIAFLNAYLILEACVLIFVLKQSFHMYNEKLNHIKDLILRDQDTKRDKEKRKERRERKEKIERRK